MEILRDPPILFFILGLLSVFFKTGLKIPSILSKFFALYLLMAIGFKGGLSLAKTGVTADFWDCLVGGLLLSIGAPIAIFLGLRKRLGYEDAAALGATYGSVSAVTFVAATTWLENRGLEFAGFMIAVLALMEAPAIIVGLILANSNPQAKGKIEFSKLLHEALLNGSVFLLLGSVLIGYLSGPYGAQSVGPFVLDLFKGFLGFFLLDLGIRSGTSIAKMKIPLWLVPVGVIVPLVSAGLALLWSVALSIPQTETFLLMTLGAGASYIAVPAALKDSLPKADAGLYMTMALGISFPFNILIGLPIYWELVKLVSG